MRLKFLFLLCFSFILHHSLIAQKVQKKVPSSWVNPIDYNTDNSGIEEGSSKYLLIDYQDNLSNQERYSHYAIKILNAEGVQEMSDISINYDPTFQKLTVHSVNVIRGDQKINKLEQNEISVLQRETNKERHLYDGSLTAVMNLSDIRAGDIIEYAYTIKGFNPINNGNFTFTYYQQYTLPVNRIYSRLVNGTTKQVHLKYREGADKTTPLNTSLGQEYIWDSDGLERTLYDNNVPNWFNTQKRVTVSTFEQWNEVVDLVYPLYRSKKLSPPQEVLNGRSSQEDRIVALIRFVQDDIRYLGFESGIAAYKPNNPATVISRRFGDCKDKSLLLVSLLEQEGITAYPFLVNTYMGHAVETLSPGLNAFDHCIVNFSFEGKEFFVDPTISNQGGDLNNLYFPKYGSGLRVKKGENALLEIPKSGKSSIEITETITIDSIGGSATFDVETVYTGSRADYMRSYFNNSTQESINNEYLNFYSDLYPSITSADKISFEDSKEGENKVVTSESYFIKEFWSKSPDNEALIYCETYPLVLENYINYPKSAQRKMPYHLGSPFEFKQKTTVKLPEAWTASPESFELDEPSFAYKSNSFALGNSVVVTHDYMLKKEALEAEDVANFLEQHDQIFTQINYQLTHYDTSSGADGLSWIAVIISILTLALGAFLFWKVYVHYNPKPHETCQQMSIGGWLVLPAIGLTLSPLIMLVQIFQEDYFSSAFWSGVQNSGVENASLLTTIIGLELFYNIAFFLFTLLVIALFYTKRTSLPKLIIVFYVLGFLVPLLETIFLSAFFPDQFSATDPESYKDIGKSMLGAVIWVPYFLVSTRVKKTFCKVYE